MPASYELLDAVNLRDVRTTTDVANALKVDASDAARQLREAEREGLVRRDLDLSVSLSDAKREFWVLTPEGYEVWDRLDANHER